MKEIKVFVAVVLIGILFSACIFNEESKKEKIIEQVKASPQVEQFLSEYPDAKIRATFLEREVVKDNINSLRYYCGEDMEVKSYWEVVIEKGDDGLEVWADDEGKAACILERGKEEITTTSSTTSTSSTTTTTISKNLKVHLVDVGEGEAILLEKEGEFGLIDCGNDYRKIWLYLFQRNVSRLEFLIVTNPKAQHLGACDVILENLPVRKVLDNGQGYDIEPYREYIKLAQRRNYQVVKKGHRIDFNGARLDFLWPPVSRPSGNVERNSIVIKLSYGEIGFMLTSDCDTSCENRLQGDLSCEILKVGHQGSALSTSPTFLRKVEPEVAIISVGHKNIYGHPSSATLSKLSKKEVHRTDLEGNIMVETDGVNYEVFPEHEPVAPTTTVPTIITTTTSSSTTTTSTTTSTSTFSTTSSTSTTSMVITTTTSTITTTLCTVECCNDWDCPSNEVTQNYTCYGDEIRTEYIDYICRYAGSPSSQCIGKMKSEFIKSCDSEKERCIEEEPYCSFISHGEYYIGEGSPEGADGILVNNQNFHHYRNFWIKIKYVLSNFKGTSPEGLCIYVKDSPGGEVRREYLTDKFYGNWINENVRIGVKKIFIGGGGISAKLWGIKEE